MNSISIIIAVLSKSHNRCYEIFAFDPIVVYLIATVFSDDLLSPVDLTEVVRKVHQQF